MTKIHHYSETKFRTFAPLKQQKVLVEMLAAIGQNISEAQFVAELTRHLAECIGWVHPEVCELFTLEEWESMQQFNGEITAHRLLAVISPLIEKYSTRSSDRDYSIARYDGTVNASHQSYRSDLPVYAILDNLRSAYNVGAIFRIAECFGLEELYLCGITPTPENNKVKMTAMGTENHVNWKHFDSTEEAVLELQKRGIMILALETAEQAVIINDFVPEQAVALILGNEALGIEPEVLKLADCVLSIPVFGKKNSLNVSTAFAIAAYKLTLK